MCSASLRPSHSPSSSLSYAPALDRQLVEPLVAFVFLAPLADEQAPTFQAPQQRIERALVDVEAPRGQGLAQRVAVVFGAQLGQHGDDADSRGAARGGAFQTGRCPSATPCATYYVPFTVYHTVLRVKRPAGSADGNGVGSADTEIGYPDLEMGIEGEDRSRGRLASGSGETPALR